MEALARRDGIYPETVAKDAPVTVGSAQRSLCCAAWAAAVAMRTVRLDGRRSERILPKTRVGWEECVRKGDSSYLAMRRSYPCLEALSHRTFPVRLSGIVWVRSISTLVVTLRTLSLVICWPCSGKSLQASYLQLDVTLTDKTMVSA